MQGLKCHVLRSFILLVLLSALLLTILRQRQNDEDEGSDRRNLTSTCSPRADRRGPHQRIISYSVPGNLSDPHVKDKYVKPLLETIRSVKLSYPGWVVRIYHSGDPSRLFKDHPHVDLCDVDQVLEDLGMETNLPYKTWRWLPLLDDLVDLMMPRDADARMIQRELNAVQEWLSSDFSFHAMRDHPLHCKELLGGMWGIKLEREDRSIIRHIALRMLKGARHQDDQNLLRDHLWPLASLDVLAHDSYCCEDFQSSRPFPTKRIGTEFVGLNGDPSAPTCPMRCRKDPDWSYC